MIVVCPPHPDGTQQISRPRGSTLSLVCKNAAGTVTWSKDGGPLPDYCHESIVIDRCYTHNQRLTIENVTKGDEGSYKCQANSMESPPLVFKLSDDTTYKLTASTGSLATTPGTNWSSTSTQPTRVEDFASLHNSISSPAAPSTQRSGTILVTGSTSKICLRGICCMMTNDCM